MIHGIESLHRAHKTKSNSTMSSTSNLDIILSKYCQNYICSTLFTKKPKLIKNINIKTGTVNRWVQSILCQLLMDLWWQSWNGNWYNVISPHDTYMRNRSQRVNPWWLITVGRPWHLERFKLLNVIKLIFLILFVFCEANSVANFQQYFFWQ